MQASRKNSVLPEAGAHPQQTAPVQSIVTHLFSMLVATFIVVLGLMAFSGQARAETRTLNIEFVHTGERASITFKRNGRYDAKGLKQLNYILRDWRRNEPTKMDPRLFDLVWEVYRQSKATGYIKAVSGYRSPATNSMLRSRSKGVAKESQHMEGTAMDFYIPGVPLKRLREIGVKMQAGGVGYYPNSGSPFVHMDVAGVRAWPRMNRQDLVRLFPDGKTVHIPSDGKPLPGYQQAMAEYKRRLASGNTVMVAEEKDTGKRRNLLAMLFRGGDEDEAEDLPETPQRPAVASQPQRQEPAPSVVTASEPAMVAEALPGVNAPVPGSRPALRSADSSLAVALYQPPRNAAGEALQQVASATPQVAEPQASEFTDLAEIAVPVPSLLGPRNAPGDASNVVTASIDPSVQALLASYNNGAVPVPANRPAVAEALLSGAQADTEAEVDEVEQAILSPEAAQALEDSNGMDQPVTTVPQMRANSPMLNAPQPAQRPTEVASIAPPERQTSAARLGDGFDAPEAKSVAADPAVPVKGGRPGQEEAERAHLAMYGGTALTKTMLEKWAMSQGRFEASAAKPGKASRVMSRTLSAPAVVPDGFRLDATTIDPTRFGNP